MQKIGNINGNRIQSNSLIFFTVIILFFAGCRSGAGEIEKGPGNEAKSGEIISEGYPLYARFSLFQNPDSTWGYTIFVNSRPYLRVSKMPFKKTSSGYGSKEDAGIVADRYVKMIRAGDLAPKLDKRTLDSIELIIEAKKNKGR
jgi:hypothetical protein